jgi:hypothetical protein
LAINLTFFFAGLWRVSRGVLAILFVAHVSVTSTYFLLPPV